MGLAPGDEVFGDDWEAGDEEDDAGGTEDDPWWSTEEWFAEVAALERLLVEDAAATMLGRIEERERVFAEAAEA